MPGKPGKNGSPGPAGKDGTITTISNNTTTIITKSVPKQTVQRLTAGGSDSIAPAGGGANYTIGSVPTGTPAINLSEFYFESHVHATDVHDVQIQALVNGSPVSGMVRRATFYAVGGSGDGVIVLSGELAGLSVGDQVGVNIVSNSGVVSAVVKEFYGSLEVYS